MSDLLQVNDIIASINNIRTCRLNHNEIVRYFKNIGDQIYLEIEYELPPEILGLSTDKIKQKTTTVSLVRDGMSFGFTIRGGIDHNSPNKTRPLVVTNVRLNSPADLSGIIKPADRITHIDNVSLKGMTLAEALTRLATGADRAQFTIEYDVSVVEAVENANGPLIIEVLKTPGVELGLNLRIINRHSITIESVMPASVADRCGALHAGDEILAIDDQDTQHLSLHEANRMLRNNEQRVRIKVLPMKQRNHRLAIEHPGFSNRFNNLGLNGFNSGSMDRLTGLGSYHPKNSQALRSEFTDFELYSDGSDFGFNIQGAIFTTEMLDTPPQICSVNPMSPADKCGRIHVGDRLIAVNGLRTVENSLDLINSTIDQAGYDGKIHIEIEYDITESFIPSCGTFQVNLLKNPNIEEFGLSFIEGGFK